jgi:hypothetical protein
MQADQKPYPGLWIDHRKALAKFITDDSETFLKKMIE